jgi:hypothetical protein
VREVHVPSQHGLGYRGRGNAVGVAVR